MRKRGTALLLMLVLLGGSSIAYAQNLPPLILQGSQTPPPSGGNPPPLSPAPGTNPPPEPNQPPVSTNMPQNLLANIPRAVQTAEIVLKYIHPGKVWLVRGPQGETVLKGAILYQGVALDTIRFDPMTGNTIPCGYNPRVPNASVSIELVKRKLCEVIKGLKIAPGVEYREPEACMIIPIIHEFKIVAHIKIYQDGIHVVPDYIVTQEMNAYGK